MSTLPSFESILLQVHQSLGCPPYQTTPKRDLHPAKNSSPII